MQYVSVAEIVGVAVFLWLTVEGEGVALSSYYPKNGPITGGTWINVTGDGFVSVGRGRSKCGFEKEDRRANAFSTFTEIHNSTYLSCIMPNLTTFYSFLPENGELIRLSVTAEGQFSNSVGFLVYNSSSIQITNIYPNQGLTNSSSTLITITGQGFINTREITCYMGINSTQHTPATFNDSSTLQCLFPSVPATSRITVTVSLNGQSVGTIASRSTLLFTFFSSPPLVTSSYFSPSYAGIVLRFDQEVEIGSEVNSQARTRLPVATTADLEIDCTQVFDNDSLLVIGTGARCSWQNTQQRVIVVSLAFDSEVYEGTILGLNNHSLRRRDVLYSRLVSGTVQVSSILGMQSNPLAVIEALSTIPLCGYYTINGDKSRYGGFRELEYEWIMGMELDLLGNIIPDPELAPYIPIGFTDRNKLRIPSTTFISEGPGSGEGIMPLQPYFIQLRVRNFLGSYSTALLQNITRANQLSPAVLIVGEQVRTVEAQRDVLLVGKVLRLHNNCTTEFNVSSYSWSVYSDELPVDLEGLKINSSILILPPGTLQPGTIYVASLRVDFETGESSIASVLLESKMELKAKLSGGERRALGSNDRIDLNGETSVIQHNSSVQLFVSWNCSTVPVTEIEVVDSSCENFTSSSGLVLYLPRGALPPGGYEFTLTLTLTWKSGNRTLLQSSASQVVIVFSYLVPRIRIVTIQNTNQYSILVHKKVIIESEVSTSLQGSLGWSVEYVKGYGQLILSPNISSTPLEYSVCTSTLLCPYSESRNPNLYTSDVIPGSSPFTNRLSLVLLTSVLLPWNFYRFKLSLVDTFGHVGFAEVDIQTEYPPSSGRLDINPVSGEALSTVFSLEALHWTDDMRGDPLLYRFGVSYHCSNSIDSAGSVIVCVDWMTGLSEENKLFSTLPYINLTLTPMLILQVTDSNGAIYKHTRSLDSIASTVNSSIEVLALMGNIELLFVRGSRWEEALAQLTALVTSIHLDHESIICNISQVRSSRFQLSNREIIGLKVRAVHLLFRLYYSFLPASESHFQVVLSLLVKATRTQCSMICCRDPVFHEGNIRMLFHVLESIASASNHFNELGTLSLRGLSRENVKNILLIYEQIFHDQYKVSENNSSFPIPRVRSDSIADSLSRLIPKLGYGLCQQQGIYEEAATVNLNEFVYLKSLHVNLPLDYVTNSCSDTNCDLETVRVNFGAELFSQYLQWICIGSRYCSGLCISSAQFSLDILWQGNEFFSLIKSPLLHLSMLNPISGRVPDFEASQSISLTFPIISLYSGSENLVCVVWNEESLSWIDNLCLTEVIQQPLSVLCQCYSLGSLYYTVLERCPDGYYGNTCNQMCPEGLWGSECRMSCDCSNRGTCSAVDGSCDCDPGWTGTTCNEVCTEGFYGKLCSGVCQCQNGAACNSVTGSCSCTHGWIGTLCNTSCTVGFYGDGCMSLCECRNSSECDPVSGSCTCQTGYSGLTCHNLCPGGSFGLRCASTCQCMVNTTKSCDPFNGSCDCHDMWMGEFCDIQITPSPIPSQSFAAVGAAVGSVMAIIIAGCIVLTLILTVLAWKKKKKKREMKVLPVFNDEESKKERANSGQSNTSDELVISRTRSLEVLIPKGKNLMDVFISSSPVAETGAAVEFMEPQEIDGKVRWQIIQVMSEERSSSEDANNNITDRDGGIHLESRESDRSDVVTKDSQKLDSNRSDKEKDAPTAQQQELTEVVYKKGVYLNNDATLRDLRNQFVDSDQLDQNEILHFQFLNSDVPGDNIDIEIEDEILLSQIERNLIQRRTLYIEKIDAAHVMGELCVCGKFADLECTSCYRRGYCSVKCQQKDWPLHEDFCRQISSKRERRRQRQRSRSREDKRSKSDLSFSEDICVCGKEAEYECSGCRKQGYCSEECQRENWSIHEYYCSRPESRGSNNSRGNTRRPSQTPLRMQREKLQTVLEESESEA